MTRFFGLTTFLVVVSVTLSAQVESLRSLARGMGGAATTHVNREIPRWPLDEMVRSADLIVRGRITQQTAFLNDDESLIFTDSWIHRRSSKAHRRSIRPYRSFSAYLGARSGWTGS